MVKKFSARFAKNIANFAKRKPAFVLVNMLLNYQCSQKCLQCSIPLKATPQTIMSFADFKIMVDKLVSYGTQGITLSGGEPTMNPDILKMMEYASGKKLFRIQLLTNLYMPDKIIDPVIDACFKYGIPIQTSFDGLGSTADTLRGAKDVSDTVIKNMKKINELNKKQDKKLQTRASVVVSGKNIRQLPQILQVLKELGWQAYADLYRWTSDNHIENEELKLAGDEDFKKAIELLKKSDRILTPDWLLDGYTDYFSGKHPKFCPYLESPAFGSKFFIHPKGDVYVCIGSKVGNLLQQTPKDIVSSNTWVNKKEMFEKCTGCWNSCYTPFYFPIRYISKANVKKYKEIFFG